MTSSSPMSCRRSRATDAYHSRVLPFRECAAQAPRGRGAPFDPFGKDNHGRSGTSTTAGQADLVDRRLGDRPRHQGPTAGPCDDHRRARHRRPARRDALLHGDGRDPGHRAGLRAAAAGLAKATGVLRSKVGAGTGVRFTPTLTFVLDTVPDAARHMEELVARARASDELVARRAAEARPAGEADPYRAPGHDDDGDPDRDDEDGDQA